MTEENKIMIDGVDVSKCIFLDEINICCVEHKTDNWKLLKHCMGQDCIQNPHCYYKQLQRKTEGLALANTQIESYIIFEQEINQQNQKLKEALIKIATIKQNCPECPLETDEGCNLECGKAMSMIAQQALKDCEDGKQ